MSDQSRWLFENDYFAWLMHGIEQVSQYGLTEVKEHLEEMARTEKNALRSQFKRLIAHLLKWKYQPDEQTTSWRLSIKDARLEIEHKINESPSLAKYLDEISKKSYQSAVNWASAETGIEDFPEELEFSLEQLLNKDFLPS